MALEDGTWTNYPALARIAREADQRLGEDLPGDHDVGGQAYHALHEIAFLRLAVRWLIEDAYEDVDHHEPGPEGVEVCNPRSEMWDRLAECEDHPVDYDGDSWVLAVAEKAMAEVAMRVPGSDRSNNND